ncbi:uncharacterized protein LOC128224383 isoform X2 [Mya arenaria]|uniref:uncharacterized protein LOC128224383 isoform X2 n=1 Tax=Mya arenaria TaxID=6604 RepID=UPI0022E0C40D|nr:uncharacterized protein LOC128224383 isoform X2 [Mya arenaria]
MHIYLVLLCLLSVVRVTGHSQFPCKDDDGPRYCAYANCTECVGFDCRRDGKRDLFKSMCCASDVAQQLEECIRLCENSSSTNLTRFDHDTKGPARLCPPNEIIGTCEQCLRCSEDMCIEDVQREVFGQQCIPKLYYDQLKSSECKDLAHTYNKSTPSMVTDDLRPSIPTKRSEMSSLPVVSISKHVITEPADTVTTTEYQTTTPSYPRTTSSAHYSTIPAYQTTTPVHLTASEHFSDGRYVGFSSIIAVIAMLVATVGKDVLKLIDLKLTGSRCLNWYNSLFCKLPEQREEKSDVEIGLLETTQSETDQRLTKMENKLEEMTSSLRDILDKPESVTNRLMQNLDTFSREVSYIRQAFLENTDEYDYRLFTFRDSRQRTIWGGINSEVY